MQKCRTDKKDYRLELIMFEKNPLLKIIFFIAAILTTLSGCSSVVADNVIVDSKKSDSYHFKITKKIPDSKFGIELEYQTVNGSGPQTFPQVTGGTSSNPTIIRPEITTNNDFSLKSASILGKWSAHESKYFGINLLIGITNLRTYVEITEPSNKKTTLKHDPSAVFTHKVELYFPINDKLKLTFGSTAGIRSDTDLQIQSLSLDYQATKFIQLNIGYKDWSYEHTGDKSYLNNYSPNVLNFDSDSNVSLSAAGLLAGMALTF